jgi:hypothetical protein
MSYNNDGTGGIDPQTLGKLNDIISYSSQLVLCPPGSECDTKKKSDELHRKYLDAQTNVRISPNELQIAEKNYYTYSLGEEGYNKYEDKEFGSKADKLIKEKEVEFERNSNLVKKLTNNIDYIIKNFENVFELHDTYVDENTQLTKEIKQSGSDIMTHDRKTYYEQQNLTILKNWYKLWYWVYIILVIIFFVLIFTNQSKYSIYVKLALLLLFIFYNFIFYRFILFFIGVVTYIVNLLPKNTNITG